MTKHEPRISEEQRNGMLEAARPLIAWMKANCHPHCVARVDQTAIELTEGVATATLSEHRCGDDCTHASDCDVHNAPALPAGPCSCHG